MSQIHIQSLFKAPEKQRSTWRSHVTSGTLHVILFLVLAAITIPAVREIRHPEARVTLIAPVIPEYRPKLIAPHVTIRPKLVVQSPAPKALPEIKPRVVTPPPPKTQILAAAPEVKPMEPPVPNLPEPKLAPPAPKPEVHTGVFQAAEQAKAQQAPKVVAVGGFGDPNGALSNSRQAPVNIAKVGSFDAPEGSGTAGGGGHGLSGGVRATSLGGFGDGTASSGTSGRRGTVQTGGFGDSTQAVAQAHAQAIPQQPALTPVEILYKPKPVYTQEARELKIQGQVLLEVIFTSSGSIRVLRVVHGLGHGLDQAAEQAATQVKFRPAMRGGVPVDSNATINITFELT
jgi:TonB family protein